MTDALRSRLEKRAVENGFESIESYVQAILVADAAGPITDDSQLEELLLDRLDGPFVDADAADFQNIRAKFEQRVKDAARRGAKP